MNLDIDLASSDVDRLRFSTISDLSIDTDASIQIANVNLINANRAYTADKYYMQFISPEYNNQNLLNHIDIGDMANNVALPDMSVKPYIQYGVGIQKR